MKLRSLIYQARTKSEKESRESDINYKKMQLDKKDEKNMLHEKIQKKDKTEKDKSSEQALLEAQQRKRHKDCFAETDYNYYSSSFLRKGKSDEKLHQSDKIN